MADAVRVTVLGSGDAFGSGGRLHSAYLVEGPGAVGLLDCGSTVLQGLKRGGIDPGRIDFVCLSHLHGDHFAGVPFLFMEYLYASPRTRPLVVCGPVGTAQRVRALFGTLYERQAREPLPFPVEYLEFAEPQRATLCGVAVEAFAVPHVPELTCFGFRLDLAGRSIVYSGDTGWTEEFVTRTAGVDLFICECTTYDTQLGIHVAYTELAVRASALACRRLVLSHVGAELLARREALSLEVADDGMVIQL